MGCCSSKRSLAAELAPAPVVPRVRVASPVPRSSAPAPSEPPRYETRHQTPAYTAPVYNDDEEDKEEFLELICELKLPAERNASNITDSVELPNGDLVLCDQRNGKLILFNENFEFVNDLALGGLPYKITDIPWRRDTVAVSVLTGNKIQYVKVGNGILQAEGIALHTTSPCRGIDCTEGMLMYVMDNLINMRDVENNVVQMEHDFDKPVSVLVDRNHGNVYILCENDDSSTRLIMARLEDNSRELDRHYPDIKTPVSMCADRRGLLYICGRDPPSIYKLSARGDNLGNVYKARFGLLQHLQYSKTNDVFMVTKPNTNKVWLYRFE